CCHLCVKQYDSQYELSLVRASLIPHTKGRRRATCPPVQRDPKQHGRYLYEDRSSRAGDPHPTARKWDHRALFPASTRALQRVVYYILTTWRRVVCLLFSGQCARDGSAGHYSDRRQCAGRSEGVGRRVRGECIFTLLAVAMMLTARVQLRALILLFV